MSMGQKPVPPANIPIPAKIGSNWVVHLPPTWDPIAFDPQPGEHAVAAAGGGSLPAHAAGADARGAEQRPLAAGGPWR